MVGSSSNDKVDRSDMSRHKSSAGDSKEEELDIQAVEE